MALTKLLLALTHLIITIYSQLCTFLHKMKVLFRKKCSEPDAAALKANRQTLFKLPHHLAVVVVEEDVSFTDLVRIALWCIAMGISCISIYDRTGVCKKNREMFTEKLEEQSRSLYSSKKPELFHVESGIEPSAVRKTHTNGMSRSLSSVRLLSESDGKQHLVSVARELSQAVQSESLKSSDINSSTVDSIIQDKSRLADPDLVVRFGVTQCLLGFLPWQIRLSEIFSLPSHKNIRYRPFLEVLQKYSDTKQRFGK